MKDLKIIEKKIINFLDEIRPEFNFNQEVDFIAEGMLDSFDIITLVDTLDKEFSVSIDGLDIIPENFCSIESIINILIKNGYKK